MKKIIFIIFLITLFPLGFCQSVFAANPSTIRVPADQDGHYQIPYYINDDGEKIYPLYIDEDGDAIYPEDEPTDMDDLIENWEETTGETVSATKSENLTYRTVHVCLVMLHLIVICLFVLEVFLLIPCARGLWNAYKNHQKPSGWNIFIAAAYPILLGCTVILHCLSATV